MSFRLVPKSVTLNDLERRNGRYFALFQRIRVASGALRKSSRSLSHLLISSCLLDLMVWIAAKESWSDLLYRVHWFWITCHADCTAS